MPITNFPFGVSSFGYPALPMGLPFHTKTRYIFIDGTYGDNAFDGKAPDKAVATLGRAHTLMVDNYGDVGVIMPGSYAERLVPTKSHTKWIGATPWMPGLVQIVGDGSAGPTIDVGTAAMEGFMLYGVEGDVPSGVEQPVLRLMSDDATAGAAAGKSGYRAYVGNFNVRSNLTRKDPRCGVLLAGATLCDFGDMHIAGCEIGIGFTGSPSNNPMDLRFHGTCVFHDNVQADIATVMGTENPAIVADRLLTRIWFNETHHLDDSGGVTRYLNLGATAASRCQISKMYTAQDIADGTMAIIPAGWTFFEQGTRNIAA